MSALSDIIALLEKWPQWRRLTGLPDRQDALEQRVLALERKLGGGTAAAGDCPRCGQGVLRFAAERPHPVFGDIAGLKVQTFRCDGAGCGFSRDVEFDPRKAS